MVTDSALQNRRSPGVLFHRNYSIKSKREIRSVQIIYAILIDHSQEETYTLEVIRFIGEILLGYFWGVGSAEAPFELLSYIYIYALSQIFDEADGYRYKRKVTTV